MHQSPRHVPLALSSNLINNAIKKAIGTTFLKYPKTDINKPELLKVYEDSNRYGLINKALSPPRISQIFQSAEIPLRKLSEILTEFLGGTSILHQNIPTEILIIFAPKFLQSGRYKKFSVEYALLVFLTKVSKSTAAKQTV